jgi:class 3 adenylate cyclase
VTCGTVLRENAKFCSECGAAVSAAAEPAEYKQATVLFADVVHSMDIAAAVGAERLREIMTALVNRAVHVVHRYGGTVDNFTGDGIMALFGAPTALEDHAIRACLSALAIQEEATTLAAEVRRCDGIELQLRIGLNSGEVIAGQLGSSQFGYTAIGEQVGMAQRMESVAPPAGNPFFAEEIVRDLIERDVLSGNLGAYVCRVDSAEVSVPARGRSANPAPSCHRLSDRDMPFEAKRFGHRAIAVGEVSIGDLVAAGTGQQSPQSQQNEIAPGPSGDHRVGGQALDRSLGLLNVAVSTAFQQGFHQNASAPKPIPQQFKAVQLINAGTQKRYCTAVSPLDHLFGDPRVDHRHVGAVVPAVHRHFTNLPA